jgi:hypothetical protein
MKKLLLTLLVFQATIFSISAQKSFEMGISGGITNYFGDLGNEAWFQTASTQPGATITFRNFLGSSKYTGNLYRPVSVEVRLSWNRLQYDETKPIGSRDGWELRNYGRGISFRNDLFGAATLVTYTLYSNPKMPLHNQSAALFVFTGAGVYYGTPKADLFRGEIDIENKYYFWPDGTVRDAAYEGSGSAGNVIEKDGEYETDLSEWYTEGGTVKGEGDKGSAYSLVHLGIPFGFGVRYGITKKITLSTEFGYYYFFTDFLDDVSDAYPTYDEINRNFPNDPVKQELALYIADPTGKGTTGYPGPATSPRGNPSKNDGFSYVSLELAYKFEFRKGIPKLWGRR